MLICFFKHQKTALCSLFIACAIAIISANSAQAQNSAYNMASDPFYNNSADPVATERPQQRPNGPQNDWDVTVGLGSIVTPEFEGAEDYDVMPLPYVDIKYKDLIELNPIEGLRLNAIRARHFKAGVGVGYDFGRDEDDSNHLQGLGDIDGSVEGLAFAEYKIGLASLGVTFAQDLGDGHEGHTATLEAGYFVPLPQYKSFLRPSISTTYASEDYVQNYFGVNTRQAARSRFAAYNPDAGFKDISASLLGGYKINDHWGMTAYLQYKQLIGDASDSPIVQDDTQITGGAFITYDF